MTHHNGHHSKTSPLVTVARDVTQVAHDIVELAELQAAMAKLELQGWWKQFILPVVLVVLATAFAAGFLLMLLAAAALQLATMAEWPLALAVLTVACAAGVMALILVGVAINRVKRARGPLEDSKQEFTRNLRWIKNSLKASARSATGSSSSPSSRTAEAN